LTKLLHGAEAGGDDVPHERRVLANLQLLGLRYALHHGRAHDHLRGNGEHASGA